MDTRMAHTLNRFGLGHRGMEPLPVDPGAWLAELLDGPDPRLATAEPTATAAFVVISAAPATSGLLHV